MGVVKVVCPSCSSQLKLSDATKPGQKVRCPKCEYGFAVPLAEADERVLAKPPESQAPPKKRRFRDDDLADAEEREDRENAESEENDTRAAAGARQHARKNAEREPSPARIWLEKNKALAGAIGGGLIIVLAIGVFFILGGGGDSKAKDANPPADTTAKKPPPPAPKVTQFNYELIKVGSKLSEVERFMGRGAAVKDTSTLPKLDAKSEEQFLKTYRASNPARIVGWEEEDDWLVVGVAGAKGAELVVFRALFRKEGDRYKADFSAEPPKKDKK